VRGVPGHWQKTLDCIESLYPLKEKFADRLRLNVNTVVCAENYREIEKLAEFMWEGFRLDGHYFNIVRGGVSEKSAEDLTRGIRQVMMLFVSCPIST